MRDHDLLLELLERERQLRADGRIADPWAHVVGDLSAAAQDIARPMPPRFNPRPPGVIRPGSATEAVLKYLQKRQDRTWVTHQQIVRATGRSAKSVDWALIFLRESGRIEASPLPDCSRYLRYRASTDLKQDQDGSGFSGSARFRPGPSFSGCN